MYAFIQNGIVTHVLRVEPSTVYAPTVAAQYVPAPDGVDVGWLYDGVEFIAPAPLPAPAPTSCTPAQGLIALYAIKQLTEKNILDAIAQIPDPVQRYTATIGYQRTITWQRGSATITTMAQLLGLTEEDLDVMFVYAVGVEV